MTIDAAFVALCAGILIPLLNTVATKLTAPPALKSLVAVILAGVSAVAAHVTGVSGVVSVREIVVVGLLALVSAAGHRYTWLSGAENVLARATANKGLGGTPVTVVHGPDDPHFG